MAGREIKGGSVMKVIYGILGRGVYSNLAEAKLEFFKTEIASKYDFRLKIDNSALWFAEAKIEELEVEKFVLRLAYYYKQHVVEGKIKVINRKEEKEAGGEEEYVIVMGNGFSCALDMFKIGGVSAEQKEMILTIVKKFNDMEVITPATRENRLKGMIESWLPKLMKGEEIRFFYKQEEVTLTANSVTDEIVLNTPDKTIVFGLETPWDERMFSLGVFWVIKKLCLC
ncbi:MAG: hypothetical protein WC180_01260 [Candidatus Paceibacterota bacterium]